MAKKDDKTEKPAAQKAEAKQQAEGKARKAGQAKQAVGPSTKQASAAPATRTVKGKEKQGDTESMSGYAPRLLGRYRSEIVPALMKEFAYRNPMEVPRLKKVVLNIGLGEAKDNPKAIESAARDLGAITGQHPVQTKAKKSIANFKLREGMVVGMMVTLRGARMYEFVDRLANVALPRIRDFRGIPKNGFDGRGSYSLGIKEQTVFPEIDFNEIDRIRGMQLTVVTTAQNDEQAKRLLDHLGFAFVKDTIGKAA